MADELSEFWGVWTSGLQAPEPVNSLQEAVDRAYALARSNAGIVVHLVKWRSEGTVKYPSQVTANGLLAQHKPKDWA